MNHKTIKKGNLKSADIALAPQKADAFFHFKVEGNPQPKQRPRKGRYGNFYTPQKTKNYEQLVKLSFLSVYESVKDADSVWEVEIEIHTTKNLDGDNVLKVILDGLTGVLWTNDNKKQLRKAGFTFIDGNEKPCVYVKVWKYNKKEM